jgi:hypothetical protein
VLQDDAKHRYDLGRIGEGDGFDERPPGFRSLPVNAAVAG